MKKTIIGLLLTVSLVITWYIYRLVWGLPLNINHFLDRSAFELLLENPEALTLLGMLDNTPLDFHSDRFSDLSTLAQAELLEMKRAHLTMLRHYDRQSLRGQALLSFDFFEHALNVQLAAYAFPWHFDNIFYQGPYPVNQVDGVHTLPLNVLASMHRVSDSDSANNLCAVGESWAAGFG